MLDLSITGDGSHSIYSEKFGAYYHSVHGAVQETEVVFIRAGFLEKLKTCSATLSILELGFGTGLNAFMTFLEANKLKINLDYTSYELYPIGYDIAKQLNYPDKLAATEFTSVFGAMHESVNKTTSFEITDESNFRFTFLNTDFSEISGNNTYDVIYFDAFAPEVQPELWSEHFLRKMYDILNFEGILVTYCAKGIFKRALKSAGFIVESLPGPIGKREMTRAIKR